MSEAHPIRNGVISTVVGGVILAVLGLVWPPAARLLNVIWNVLGTIVAVPVWVIAVVVVGVVALVRRAARRQVSALPALSVGLIDASAPRIAPQSPVDRLERRIFERLVKADGASVSFASLLRATDTTRLRLQAELERLKASNLIEVSDDLSEGNLDIYLTARGRQYVVQLGLV